MTTQTKIKKYLEYDVVIIGAGVSGAAQAYALAKYTNIKKVALLEKESDAGMINSSPLNNSQTLHEGDIETNYSFDKARAVQHKAFFTRSYVSRALVAGLSLPGPKMVLGVGPAEVAFLEERFAAFSELYPTLQKIGRNEIAKYEPKLIEGRSEGEEVLALYNPDGLTIDYAKLAESLVAEAVEAFASGEERVLDTFFGTEVIEIKRLEVGYEIVTKNRIIHTRFLSVCAGAHSMYFAKLLNIPEVKDLSLLNVAGNFYHTPKFLNSKVYTVQNPKLPFSAVHGDPDIMDSTKTRYGPTTRIVFALERHKLGTVLEYLVTMRPFFRSLLAYWRILGDRNFFWYALKHNLLFALPYLGTALFAREVRKIIPSITTKDITLAKGQGGVRPQIVDTKAKNPLNLGEAKLSGKNVLFNVTPSPGATTCIYNSLVDVSEIARSLNASFADTKIVEDFGMDLVLKIRN